MVLRKGKILFAVLTVLLVLVFAVSCGKKKAEAASSVATPDAKAPAEVASPETSAVKSGANAQPDVDAALKEAEEAARVEAEKAEAEARRIAKEAEKAHAEAEKAREEAEEVAKRAKEEAEKAARRAREQAENAAREAEAAEKRAQEEAEKALREVDEASRREAEEVARKARDEAEKARKDAEEAARKAKEEAEKAAQAEHSVLVGATAVAPEDNQAPQSVANTSVESGKSEKDLLMEAREAAKAQRAEAEKASDADSGFVLFGRKNMSLSLYFSPYGYRSVKSTASLEEISNWWCEEHPDHVFSPETADPLINSKYGIGGKGKFRYHFGSGFYASVDALAETYMLRDLMDGYNYTDVVFMPKAGFTANLGEKFALFAEAGFGVDLICFDEYCRVQWLLGMELGFAYRLNDHWSIETSGEAGWSWHGEPGRYYAPASAWMINTFIGATYKF